ncbi:hypothetical protein BCR37DRAFT_24573 [Protomyces lactucae-debilis]|uniref:Uncharacterized protein n=1 Tax=Protomyces lactucae-debilis TaxID=2754530 RepID=A0A1Y2FDF7_PROLT|nr:uncharacterized protein BCR37DRAFT_24573 [Protomyces lactucae-debilis]ORY81952.1 hypothetical protein BCR37DRAFT_24573 [Protomyces lactucae-debilis]
MGDTRPRRACTTRTWRDLYNHRPVKYDAECKYGRSPKKKGRFSPMRTRSSDLRAITDCRAIELQPEEIPKNRSRLFALPSPASSDIHAMDTPGPLASQRPPSALRTPPPSLRLTLRYRKPSSALSLSISSLTTSSGADEPDTDDDSPEISTSRIAAERLFDLPRDSLGLQDVETTPPCSLPVESFQPSSTPRPVLGRCDEIELSIGRLEATVKESRLHMEARLDALVMKLEHVSNTLEASVQEIVDAGRQDAWKNQQAILALLRQLVGDSTMSVPLTTPK